MSFVIEENTNFFSSYEGIRYLTGSDKLFAPNSFSGVLYFYPGNPARIVVIEVYKPLKRKLEEKDIHILLGTRHNSLSIKDDIEKNRDAIYEMCASMKSGVFVLNLSNMHVVEREDFVDNRPNYGLSTLFVFENLNGIYYSLVNPTLRLERPLPDIHFYVWLLSYIYSQACCLSPTKDMDLRLGKQFMQAMSCLASTKGRKENLFISNDPYVLSNEIGDMNEFDLPAPTEKITRFMELANKAIEEMHPREKGKK